MKDYASKCLPPAFSYAVSFLWLGKSTRHQGLQGDRPGGLQGICTVAVLVVLPGMTSTLQPVMLRLGPAARLLQVALGLFSSKQFCCGDSEPQLWQKAMSSPRLPGREQCTGVVVLPSAFQSRFQKLGQGGI